MHEIVGITDFVDIVGPARPLPHLRTRARILWDDEALYIAAELEVLEGSTRS